MERLYTLKEASKLLGVHVKTIQKWDREGKINERRAEVGEHQGVRELMKAHVC